MWLYTTSLFELIEHKRKGPMNSNYITKASVYLLVDYLEEPPVALPSDLLNKAGPANLSVTHCYLLNMTFQKIVKLHSDLRILTQLQLVGV